MRSDSQSVWETAYEGLLWNTHGPFLEIMLPRTSSSSIESFSNVVIRHMSVYFSHPIQLATPSLALVSIRSGTSTIKQMPDHCLRNPEALTLTLV